MRLALALLITCLFTSLSLAQEKPPTKITLNSGEVITVPEAWDNTLYVWFVRDGKTVMIDRKDVKSIERPKTEAEKRREEFEAKAREPKRAEVTYDRFKDTTTVNTGRIQVAGEILDGLSISIFFVFDGQRLTATPKGVNVLFASTSKDWKFLGYTPALIAIVDGVRVQIGRPLPADRNVGRGYVTEFFAMPLLTALLDKIANAKKVEVQFGTYEFELTTEQKDRLKEFLTHTRP